MNYPFERYLKHQILLGRPISVIREFLVTEFKFAVSTKFEDEVEELKEELAATSTAVKHWLAGKRKRPPNREEWLAALETDLELTEELERDLLAFLQVAPVRELAQALVVKELDAERVAYELELKFSYPVDRPLLNLFIAYFWDGLRMEFGDWYAYSQLVVDQHERLRFEAVLSSDLNHVIWLLGAQSEFNEEDF